MPGQVGANDLALKLWKQYSEKGDERTVVIKQLLQWGYGRGIQKRDIGMVNGEGGGKNGTRGREGEGRWDGERQRENKIQSYNQWQNDIPISQKRKQKNKKEKKLTHPRN